MGTFRIALLSVLISFFVVSAASAEKQICKDLKTIGDWDLNLNFAKLNGGDEAIRELARSEEYEAAYQSYARLIRSIKLAEVTSHRNSLARSLVDCIEDISDGRRQVPSLMGYDLSTPFSSEVFSRELINQIESNADFKQGLVESMGKDHFENFMSYLKSSEFEDTTALEVLGGISVAGWVVAVGAIIGVVVALLTAGFGFAAFFGLVLLVGAGAILVDNIVVGVQSVRAKAAIYMLDDKVKTEISIESAKIANLIIQNSVKSKLTQEQSLQNPLR